MNSAVGALHNLNALVFGQTVSFRRIYLSRFLSRSRYLDHRLISYATRTFLIYSPPHQCSLNRRTFWVKLSAIWKLPTLIVSSTCCRVGLMLPQVCFDSYSVIRYAIGQLYTGQSGTSVEARERGSLCQGKVLLMFRYLYIMSPSSSFCSTDYKNEEF